MTTAYLSKQSPLTLLFCLSSFSLLDEFRSCGIDIWPWWLTTTPVVVVVVAQLNVRSIDQLLAMHGASLSCWRKINQKVEHENERKVFQKKLRLCCCCCCCCCCNNITQLLESFFRLDPSSFLSFHSFLVDFILFYCFPLWWWRGFRHTSTTAHEMFLSLPQQQQHHPRGGWGGDRKSQSFFDTDLSSLCKNFVGYRS